MRIHGRRIGTILHPSTAATSKSVSEFCVNTVEVTKVCERGERRATRLKVRIVYKDQVYFQVIPHLHHMRIFFSGWSSGSEEVVLVQT